MKDFSNATKVGLIIMLISDSIREIIKKAEADTELSNWNKLRIINECQSALINLWHN